MSDQTPTEIDERKMVLAAEVLLERIDTIVDKAMKPWKRAVRVLIGVVVALIAGASLSGYLYFNQVQTSHAVQQNQTALRASIVAGCESQNTRSLNDAANWDYFIGILAKGDTKPADLAEVKTIEHHIATVDAPRNCAADYGGK